ncbi:hypothetical protein EZS27_002238 [termite gut metagenome]|uniref:Uncharacterized protein n=1 Tax=termite gut metagenome TaxID=433724 RepID=A0A5J4SYF6_9ZZZZ
MRKIMILRLRKSEEETGLQKKCKCIMESDSMCLKNKYLLTTTMIGLKKINSKLIEDIEKT